MSAEATRPERRSAADRAWALQVLEVAADASPRELHAAVLDHLQKADFLPSPPLEQAVLLVADELPAALWARDPGTEMYTAREREVSKYVERLAKMFFSLEPAKRRAAWQAAKQRAAFSIPLNARLDGLAAGLDVTLPASMGEDASFTDRLAQAVCQSFVMVPSARAAWREEQVQRAMADPRRWQAAAREFQQRYPQLLRLAPELIASLFQATELRENVVKTAVQAERKQIKAAPRRKIVLAPRFYGWIAVVVVSMVVRGLMTASHSGSSRTPSAPPVAPQAVPNVTAPRFLPPGNSLPSREPDTVQRRFVPASGSMDSKWKSPSGNPNRRRNEPQAVDLLQDGERTSPSRVTPPSSDFDEGLPFPHPQAIPPTGLPGRRPPR